MTSRSSDLETGSVRPLVSRTESDRSQARGVDNSLIRVAVERLTEKERIARMEGMVIPREDGPSEVEPSPSQRASAISVGATLIAEDGSTPPSRAASGQMKVNPLPLLRGTYTHS